MQPGGASADLALERLSYLVSDLEQDTNAPLLHRLKRLDRLEHYLLYASAPTNLLARARALETKLEAANVYEFANIRRDIQQGQGRESLLRYLSPHAGANAHRDGYDELDDLIAGVLAFDQPGSTSVHATEEMVFYQPTPARHIFELLRRAALTSKDVLVDMGSGLGHVPILASICTDAHSVGVEVEPVYVACAQQVVEALQLSRITFLQQDARAFDYTTGTVFYFYTPFTGTILRAILDLLEQQAQQRPIRICTFGPCVSTIQEQTWLQPVEPTAANRISMFRSRG